jgi:hypothetical protein
MGGRRTVTGRGLRGWWFVAIPIASVAVCSNKGKGRCAKEAGDSDRQGVPGLVVATPTASVAVCINKGRGDHTEETGDSNSKGRGMVVNRACRLGHGG